MYVITYLWRYVPMMRLLDIVSYLGHIMLSEWICRLLEIIPGRQ